MGAWIETWEAANEVSDDLHVAPFMGAWIETYSCDYEFKANDVAPFMGAWIETLKVVICMSVMGGRSLHGSVD